MSTLRFEKLTLPSANLGGESSLPLLPDHRIANLTRLRILTEEDDGLYINYGGLSSAFPYKAQDLYDRALEEKSYDAAILENSKLKATFMPCFGGKLWSLIDKTTGRELLFSNDVVRPCYLAVRNAWTSGGVEWNMGFLGHGPFTCSLINTARTQLEDGTPVLRFYYFERIRACITQMDIFLPEDSDVLYVRVRLTNPNEEVVPMYWWSNIATVQEPGARVIAPATAAFIYTPEGITKSPMPEYFGTDVSYPQDNPTARDYFFKTQENNLKYICQLDREGYGLANASTDRLKGRKLFVWGDTPGGRRWMNFLTADDMSGSYNEIQCGLGYIQGECVPMPPRTAWEWLESYGAMQADKEKIHGSWEEARQEVEARFDVPTKKATLERILADTKAMAKSPAQPVFLAEDWGALEQARRVKADESDLMCAHLDFGKPSVQQAVWQMLLTDGTVGNHNVADVPESYQVQKQWISLLEAATEGKDRDNWYAHYLLGTAQFATNDLEKAKQSLLRSLSLAESPWANYALAIMAKWEKDSQEYVSRMLRAFSLRNDDISLAKETFRCLYEAEMSEKAVELFQTVNPEIRANTRCRLYYAYALARLGQVDEAEQILCGNGDYLVVSDILEGETITTQLWDFIQDSRGRTGEGRLPPPYMLDFRMSYNS